MKFEELGQIGPQKTWHEEFLLRNTDLKKKTHILNFPFSSSFGLSSRTSGGANVAIFNEFVRDTKKTESLVSILDIND